MIKIKLKVLKKQRQDSARKTIERTHRGDDSNFNEIIPCDQEPVESVNKTTVNPHRRIDGRFSTKTLCDSN